MALELIIDRFYQIPELRMEGYVPAKIVDIQALPLLQRYGARKVIHYVKGDEHLYFINDSGHLRLYTRFIQSFKRK